MSTGDGNFLSRWSQRKHEATLPDSETPVEQATEIPTESPQRAAESTAEEEFDLSSLPKLEDVAEGTDITGFLKNGVPESVRNAALRKSWALDPAIRNYVNPALEYAYDWNTPGGVPGSSELAAGMDVARMVLQIMGGGESASAAVTSDAPDPLTQTDSNVPTSLGLNVDAAQDFVTDLPTEGVRSSDAMIFPTRIPADSEQVERSETESDRATEAVSVGASQQVVRRHGTAKPKV